MFCVKCGKELVDEAVVCTGCGCQTHNLNVSTKKAKVRNEDSNEKGRITTATIVISVICFILNLTCIVFSLLTFSMGYTFSMLSAFLFIPTILMTVVNVYMQEGKNWLTAFLLGTTIMTFAFCTTIFLTKIMANTEWLPF